MSFDKLSEAFEEYLKEDAGGLIAFGTSSQPNILWVKYRGSKKCDMCDKSAELQAIEGKKIVGYSCDDHNFDMFND